MIVSRMLLSYYDYYYHITIIHIIIWIITYATQYDCVAYVLAWQFQYVIGHIIVIWSCCMLEAGRNLHVLHKCQ